MTFFVDRSLGRYDVPRALRSAGFDIVEHDEIFDDTTSDADWLEHCARRKWIVLSKDAALRLQPEVHVIRRRGLHVYVVTNASLSGPRTAALLVSLAVRIERRAAKQRGGYVVGVYRDAPHLRTLVRARRR